jgi:hypothetical protein
MKRVPSVQAEAWLILSESQQALAYLLGSGQTCAPAASIIKQDMLWYHTARRQKEVINAFVIIF